MKEVDLRALQNEFLPFILPSKNMRECCIREERIFRPWEIASLLYMNDHLTFSRRAELFKNLTDKIEASNPDKNEKPDFPNISDFELLEQLKNHIVYEDFLLKNFYDNKAATYSYLIHNENDDYRAARYEDFYSTAEKAKVDALKELEEYHKKENGEYETNEIQIAKFFVDECTTLAGTFNLEGELKTLSFCGKNLKKIIPECFQKYYDLPDVNYFAEKYVHLPHPFRAGDFVQTIGEKTIGIYTGDENEEAYQKNQLHLKKLETNQELICPIDISDISCRVEYYDSKSKYFSHEHPGLTDLEKVTPPEDFKYKDLFKIASELLRSGGSIEALQDYLERG